MPHLPRPAVTSAGSATRLDRPRRRRRCGPAALPRPVAPSDAEPEAARRPRGDALDVERRPAAPSSVTGTAPVDHGGRPATRRARAGAWSCRRRRSPSTGASASAGSARERAERPPADRVAGGVVGGDDLRERGASAAEAEHRDATRGRSDRRVVGLAGDHEQVARRDRQDALGPVRRRQDLHERGFAASVTSYTATKFDRSEPTNAYGVPPNVRDRQALGLGALLGRPGPRCAGPCGRRGARSVLPASQTDRAGGASKTVQPRVPPFQSPSLAVATWSSSSQAIASGSRGTSGCEPVWSMTPSLAVSMPSTVDGARGERARSPSPVAMSTRATPLFSCSVTATWPRSG